MNRTVAVLLSTYNGEKYLDKLLTSIYEQEDVTPIVCVRDDGSKDSTFAILESWSEKLQIERICSERNLGSAGSFWELCRKAIKADYYAFCDQDDEWDKDKLAAAVKSLEGIEKPALYFCDERTIDSESRLLTSGTETQPIVTFESEIVCGYCPGCAMVFNDALLQILVKQQYSNIYMHDMLVLLNAFIHGEVIYDQEPHFSRRMHADNVWAADGRTGLSKIKHKLKKIFSENRIRLDVFLGEVLKNNSFEEHPEYKEELELLANYRHHPVNKLRILRNKRFTSAEYKGLRSFRIRTIMGWL